MSARACIVPVFVPHLGCPHACVFCNQNRISGTLRPASAEDVKKAIADAASLPREGKRQLAFYGGSFTAIPVEEQEALLSAARHALERGEIDSIRLSTRPDAIDGKTLDCLAAYGVETIELGAQSMDEGVLRLSCRGHSAADVERASRMIRARGFSLILQMMTGLPGDTEEKDLETARRLIALQPEGVRIYPTVIVRDTALEKLWERGAYREHTVEDAVRVCARLLPLFEEAGIPVSTARAGNVIGGGDFAKDRLVPDAVRACLKGEPVALRNPSSVRPWQHVLEPLSAYLLLAEKQAADPALAGAWNVGPAPEDMVPTQRIAELFTEAWGSGASVTFTPDDGPHEASLLMLDSAKLRETLGWKSRMNIAEAVRASAVWSKEVLRDGADARAVSDRQIRVYFER